MAMPKAGDDDIAWFDQLLPDAPGVTRRSMFGNLGGFVDGQMFLALLGDRVAVRLDPAGCDELLRVDGTAPFEPMPGRPMREYVVLPLAWRDDITAAALWIGRSMTYAAGLPPKHAPRRRRRSRWRASRWPLDLDDGMEAPPPPVGGPAPAEPVADPPAGSTEAEPAAGPQPGSGEERVGSTNGAAGGSTRPINAETPSRAHRAARNRAAARRTTTRSAGRTRRSGG